MPGYYIHLATITGKSAENRSFVCGVEAPDILKKHLRDANGDFEKARVKYEAMRTEDMPSYDTFIPRLMQVEERGSTDGMHFGKSSSTNVRAFWTSLTKAQREMPFYKGYAWHLLTDAIMYGRLNINARFEKTLHARNVTPEEWATERAKEVEVLHDDWDKTNAKVRKAYPEVKLTPEVEELNIVQFIEDGELTYVEWRLLKRTIDYLRSFDPITENMDVLIEKILCNI